MKINNTAVDLTRYAGTASESTGVLNAVKARFVERKQIKLEKEIRAFEERMEAKAEKSGKSLFSRFFGGSKESQDNKFAVINPPTSNNKNNASVSPINTANPFKISEHEVVTSARPIADIPKPLTATANKKPHHDDIFYPLDDIIPANDFNETSDVFYVKRRTFGHQQAEPLPEVKEKTDKPQLSSEKSDETLLVFADAAKIEKQTAKTFRMGKAKEYNMEPDAKGLPSDAEIKAARIELAKRNIKALCDPNTPVIVKRSLYPSKPGEEQLRMEKGVFVGHVPSLIESEISVKGLPLTKKESDFSSQHVIDQLNRPRNYVDKKLSDDVDAAFVEFPSPKTFVDAEVSKEVDKVFQKIVVKKSA